ncbi:DMT superfamily inner membrane transporter protein [Rhizobium etli]|uniref:DMT superfamily inner membrane transporter protein n=1 Tax=Rhizobium etli TaxID=29449 RepID=A0AAN1BHB8_RHIET|nr:DMT superfamily inner membrane transporter protein [Rhizobium etli]
MDSRMSAWIWGLLLLLGLIWGGSFFFARIAVQHIPPLTLVFLRLLLAGLALHIYIAGRFDIYSTLKARWREFLILGLINNALPHALIFFGQTRIGAGLAAILNATTPIWTVLIANYLTSDEKLCSAKIAGCLVGLAGTIVLVGPGLSASGQAPFWALLLPVLAAISYGFAATYGKRFKDVPAPVTAAGQLTASSLITLPLSLLADRPWTLSLPPLDILLAVLALALVSTAFAYILSDHGGGRRHQRLTCHPAGAAKRDPSRRAFPRRTAGGWRIRRHGADRFRPCHPRWPRLPPAGESRLIAGCVFSMFSTGCRTAMFQAHR